MLKSELPHGSGRTEFSCFLVALELLGNVSKQAPELPFVEVRVRVDMLLAQLNGFLLEARVDHALDGGDYELQLLK